MGVCIATILVLYGQRHRDHELKAHVGYPGRPYFNYKNKNQTKPNLSSLLHVMMFRCFHPGEHWLSSPAQTVLNSITLDSS